MANSAFISIIICTQNHADSLARTLAAMSKLRIPHEWRCELIVVDNASTDHTPKVAQNADLKNVESHILVEKRPGQCHARNTGLSRAKGDYILFTDDDVVPSPDWARQMVLPLLDGRFDAVTGRTLLSSDLIRPWMDGMHRLWLGDYETDAGVRVDLIGANMGFKRSVLGSVPAFDPELGPGASGFSDDSLFSYQLRQAGLRIGFAREAVVVHCPDVSRLQRCEWLAAARKRGRSNAYIRYHWEHLDISNRQLKLYRLWLKLNLRKRLQRPIPATGEGCSSWEMSYEKEMEALRQFAIESSRPRNYAKRGLVKIGFPEAPIPKQEVASLTPYPR